MFNNVIATSVIKSMQHNKQNCFIINTLEERVHPLVKHMVTTSQTGKTERLNIV